MKRFTAAVIAVAGMSSTALAGVEIGGVAGVHVFSEDNALGDVPGPKSTSQQNSALFALRIGVGITDMFSVELEGGIIPGEPRSVLFDIVNAVYRGQVVAQFRAADPNNKLLPFVLVGAGALQVVDSKNTDIIKEETVFTPYVGIGAKYRAQNGWGVRLDARVLLPPKKDSGITTDFEALLSIYKEIGRKQPAKQELPPPEPVVDQDPDKDGILGAADACPNEPEDMDGFEDENGCPDPDNDGDGIPDTEDKCPLEAEDKDGFQDEDGCPDLDNDGDGIPDTADKCPSEPETKNGFQDEDGCPDEIPEKLKQFTGVIQGINFKTSSIDLAPGSAKVLDAAVAVLTEFKDTKLEIQGHTDDQKLGKTSKFADNTALSQGRAESVKAYFVSKGIDESRLIAKGYGDTAPVVDPTGLKGGKLTAARAKNRRVEFKLITEEPAAAPAPAAPATAPAPAETAPAPATP
ncbi:MAG: OmpA family protein [Kofleriaceae bacterium]